MIYFKSLLVGVVTAVITTIVWLVGEFLVLGAMAAREMAKQPDGGLGAVSLPSFIPLVTLAGFALGFLLSFRRLRRTQQKR